MSSKLKGKTTSPDKHKSKNAISSEKHAQKNLTADDSSSADKLNGDPAFDKYVWREEEEFTPPPLGKDRKRLVHNIVEKKRKDKIKTWINTIGEILPNHLFKDTEKNTITTLEKTVDYLTDLKQKNELLLQDKGSQVQANEIASLEKQLDELQTTVSRYEKMLREAGIGFTLEPGSLWKQKNNKFSGLLNAASSVVSASGTSTEAPSTSDSVSSDSWKGAENVTNKTAADSTSENVDALSLKQEIKTEGTKKKRVRNRNSLVSTQLKDQTNNQSQSPSVVQPPGGGHGNQDMLGAAMNAASIGMGTAGHAGLNFAGSNQIMYAGNQLIAPHGSSVTNVNQMIMPAPMAGATNPMLMPQSGLMSVVNSGMTQGITQNGFVYMQPGSSAIGQPSAGGDPSVVTPTGGLLQMTPQNLQQNKTTDDAQTMSTTQTMNNQIVYNQNNALQTLASIATSNQGNTSVPMVTTVLPQSSNAALTSSVTTVTQVLNSTVPIMSASANQSAANTSTVQSLTPSVNMPFMQSVAPGTGVLPQMTNPNAGMQSQGSFIIHNGQLIFVNNEVAGQGAQVKGATSQAALSAASTPGGNTGDTGGQTQSQEDGRGSATIAMTTALSGSSQAPGALAQSVSQQGSQVNLSMIGQPQTLIRPQQMVNQSQMPLYNNLQPTQMQQSVVASQQLTTNGAPSSQPMTLATQTQSVGGATVAQTSQPSGYITVNTVPSQPNQLPSALILPNGQIIPVVTQPSLLFQPGTPSSGNAVSNNMVVTPSGQMIQQPNLVSKPASSAPMMTGQSQSFVFPPTSSDLLANSMNLSNGGVQTPNVPPGTLTTSTSLTTAKPQTSGLANSAGLIITGSGSTAAVTNSLQNQFINQQNLVQMSQAPANQGLKTPVNLPNVIVTQGLTGTSASLTLPASTPTQTVHHLPQSSVPAIRPSAPIVQSTAPSSVPDTPNTPTSLNSNFSTSANSTLPGQPMLGNGTILLVDSNGVPIGTIPAGQSLPNPVPPPSATSKKAPKKAGQRVLMPKPPNFSTSHTPNFATHATSFNYAGLQANLPTLQPSQGLWNAPLFTSVTDGNSLDATANQNNKTVTNTNSVTMTTKTSSASGGGNGKAGDSSASANSTQPVTSVSTSVSKTEFTSITVTTSATDTTCSAQTDILAQAAESIFSSMSEISPQIGDYCTADDENALHIDTSVGEVDESASPVHPGVETQEKKPKLGGTTVNSKQEAASASQNEKSNSQNEGVTNLLSDSSHEVSDLIIDTGDLEIPEQQTDQGQTTSNTPSQMTSQGQATLTSPQIVSANQVPLYSASASTSLGLTNQMPQTVQSSIAANPVMSLMSPAANPQSGENASLNPQQSVAEQNERLQQTMELMQGPPVAPSIPPPARHLLVSPGTTTALHTQAVPLPDISPTTASSKTEETKKKNSGKSRKSSSDPNKPSKKKSKKAAASVTVATTSAPTPIVSQSTATTVTAITTTPTNQTVDSVVVTSSADNRPEDFLPETITFTESELSQVLDQVESLGQSLQTGEENPTPNEDASQTHHQVAVTGETPMDTQTDIVAASMQSEGIVDTSACDVPTPTVQTGQARDVSSKESKKSRSRKSKSSHSPTDQPVNKRKKKSGGSSNNVITESSETTGIYTSQIMLEGFSAAMEDTANMSVPSDVPSNTNGEMDSARDETSSAIVGDKDAASNQKEMQQCVDDDADKQSTSSLQMDLLLNFDSPAPVVHSSATPNVVEADKKEMEESPMSSNMMETCASPLSSPSPMHHAHSLASPVLSSPEPVLTIITGDLPPTSSSTHANLSPQKAAMYPPMSTNVPINSKKLHMQSPPSRGQQAMQLSPSASRGQHSLQMSPSASGRGQHNAVHMSPVHVGSQNTMANQSPVKSQLNMQMSSPSSGPTVLPSAGNNTQQQHPQLQESSGRSIFDSVKSMASTGSMPPMSMACQTSAAASTPSSEDSISRNLNLLSKMATSPTMLSPPNLSVTPPPPPQAGNLIKSRDVKTHKSNSSAMETKPSLTVTTASVPMMSANPVMTSPPSHSNQGQSQGHGRNRNRNRSQKEAMNETMHQQQSAKMEAPPGGQKLQHTPPHGLYPGATGGGRNSQYPVNLSTSRDSDDRDMRMGNPGLPPHMSMLPQNSHLTHARGPPYTGIPGPMDSGVTAYPSPHLNYSAQSLFTNESHNSKNSASHHQPHAGQMSSMGDSGSSLSSGNSGAQNRPVGGASSPAPLQHRSNFYLSDTLSSPHAELRSPYGGSHQKEKASDGGMNRPRLTAPGHIPGMGIQDNYSFPSFGMSSSSVATTTASSTVVTSSMTTVTKTTSANSFTFSLTSATTTTASNSVSGHMPAHHHQFPFFPLHPSLAQHGHPPPPPPMHRTTPAVSSASSSSASSSSSSLPAAAMSSGSVMSHSMAFGRDSLPHTDHPTPGHVQHHHSTTPSSLSAMQASPRLPHHRPPGPPSGPNQNLRHGSNPADRLTSPSSGSRPPPPPLTQARNPRSSSSSTGYPSQSFATDEPGMRGRDSGPPFMDRVPLSHPSREQRNSSTSAHTVNEVKQSAPSGGGLNVAENRGGLQQRTGSGLCVSQNTASQRPRSGSLPRSSPHVNSEIGPFFNPSGFPSPSAGMPLNSPNLHHAPREPMSGPPGVLQRNANFENSFPPSEFPGMAPFNAPNFEPPLQVPRTSANSSETNTFSPATNQNVTAGVATRTTTSKSVKSGSKSKSSKSKKKKVPTATLR